MMTRWRARTPLAWMYPALAVLAMTACETMAPEDPGNLVPRTVAEDPSLPAIEMNGSRFHAETFGSAANPVIVILHGGPGGDYRGMLRLAGRYGGYSLADEYFMVFWDQRGTGLSQRHSLREINGDIYLDDLNTLIDRYSPGRPVILVGESWGGMFATQYINTYPQRVAAAVLIEPGPMVGADMERLKGDIEHLDLGSEFLNDYAWSTQFLSTDDHARMDYARAQGLAGETQPKFGLSRTDPAPIWREGVVAHRAITESGQNANGRFVYDFTTDLEAFTTPVQFITGSLSQILGASLQQKQVQYYPSAALRVVEGAGHDVAWVKASEVVGIIRAYLDDRRAAAGGIQ